MKKEKLSSIFLLGGKTVFTTPLTRNTLSTNITNLISASGNGSESTVDIETKRMPGSVRNRAGSVWRYLESTKSCAGPIDTKLPGTFYLNAEQVRNVSPGAWVRRESLLSTYSVFHDHGSSWSITGHKNHCTHVAQHVLLVVAVAQSRLWRDKVHVTSQWQGSRTCRGITCDVTGAWTLSRHNHCRSESPSVATDHDSWWSWLFMGHKNRSLNPQNLLSELLNLLNSLSTALS